MRHSFNCWKKGAISTLNVAFNLLLVEVVFLAVLRTEFDAVSGDEPSADQLKVFGNLHCGPENHFNGTGVVAPKVGNGVMIGLKAF